MDRVVCFAQVERRRRDTINSWIMKLGKLIPDLFNPESGPPRQNLLSKGGILARACDYLTELRTENQELRNSHRDEADKVESLEMANQQLQSQIDILRSENASLRRRLEEHGDVYLGGQVSDDVDVEDDDDDDDDEGDKGELIGDLHP